jgi:hypothetical protein
LGAVEYRPGGLTNVNIRRQAFRQNPSQGGNAMQLARYVKFREEKFGGVLFETRSEKVFCLNPTGAAVVREIEVGGGPEEIAARLAQRFDDPGDGIAREVQAFIDALRERGLVDDGQRA